MNMASNSSVVASIAQNRIKFLVLFAALHQYYNKCFLCYCSYPLTVTEQNFKTYSVR